MAIDPRAVPRFTPLFTLRCMVRLHRRALLLICTVAGWRVRGSYRVELSEVKAALRRIRVDTTSGLGDLVRAGERLDDTFERYRDVLDRFFATRGDHAH